MAVITSLFLGACSLTDKDSSKDEGSDDGLYEKKFGSYRIDDEDWVEVRSHSQAPYYFSYCREDQEDESRPNNIAVFYSENKYTRDEHEDFRDAILMQLGTQAQEAGATVMSSGTETEKGYIAYRFELECENDTTIQYYIIGDKEYVMVSAAIWDRESAEEDGVYEVLDQIVDSFEFDD